MIDTMEQLKILQFAEELTEMILESEIVDHYYKCFQNVQSNEESMKKIKKFSEMKEKYEDVQRFGHHHPDYKKVMKEIHVVKRTMDLDPLVAEFKKAENELQQLLDEISILIGHAVSKQIKVQTGNPFFVNSAHRTGGCGTGGSCGCA